MNSLQLAVGSFGDRQDAGIQVRRFAQDDRAANLKIGHYTRKKTREWTPPFLRQGKQKAGATKAGKAKSRSGDRRSQETQKPTCARRECGMVAKLKTGRYTG